ncbi:MAG: NAD-dependent epimerase/dehydratase family protein [Pseudomonadota bacterium]
MRLVILGSNGKLARLLRSAWPKNPDLEPIWLNSSLLDLRQDTPRLADMLKDADAILNLAGVTRQTETRSFEDNPVIARTVLQAASGAPVLLCSSAAVYGDTDDVCHETMTPQPVSAYGSSKLAMERIAANFAGATCLRISNVAGADALFGQEKSHYQLDQFPGGGFPTRSYIGPHHLAAIISQLSSMAYRGVALPNILNIAAELPVSMDALLTEAGKSWEAKPAPRHAIERVELDISRLANLMETKSPYASVLQDLHAVGR